MMIFESGEDIKITYRKEPKDLGEGRQWLQRRIHQRAPLYSE